MTDKHATRDAGPVTRGSTGSPRANQAGPYGRPLYACVYRLPALDAGAAPAALSAPSGLSAFHRWGLTTLGEVAALPAADVRARLGPEGLIWHAMARGDDTRPLVPAQPDERFDGAIDLEWPIEELEP